MSNDKEELAAKPLSETEALLIEVDAVADKLLLEVEWKTSHRMNAALYERALSLLAKLGGYLLHQRSLEAGQSSQAIKKDKTLAAKVKKQINYALGALSTVPLINDDTGRLHLVGNAKDYLKEALAILRAEAKAEGTE